MSGNNFEEIQIIGTGVYNYVPFQTEPGADDGQTFVGIISETADFDATIVVNSGIENSLDGKAGYQDGWNENIAPSITIINISVDGSDITSQFTDLPSPFSEFPLISTDQIENYNTPEPGVYYNDTQNFYYSGNQTNDVPVAFDDADYPYVGAYNYVSYEDITFASLIGTNFSVDVLGGGGFYPYPAPSYYYRSLIRSIGTVTIESSYGILFSNQEDNVDFNDLTENQILAIENGADLYESLHGSDIITLPDDASAANLADTGVSFDLSDVLSGEDGTDTFDFTRDDGLAGYALGETLHIDAGGPAVPLTGTQVGTVILPGVPSDYVYIVSFTNGDSWNSTQTAISYYADGYSSGATPSVTIDTADIEKAIIRDDMITNQVALFDGNLYAEMAELAQKEVYGYEAGMFHPNDPLAYQVYDPNVLSTGSLAEARGWHEVSAIELGMLPADYGLGANGLEYSFVDGLYQAINPQDFNSLLGPPEADALVLTGVIAGKPTLTVVFRGTDQKEDFIDYPSFLTDQYPDFAPLVTALKAYLVANPDLQVLVDGHSLGGGLAQIFAADVSTVINPNRISVFTFGSPGAEELAPPGVAQINIFHANDPVATLSQQASDPATLTGFVTRVVAAGLLAGGGGILGGLGGVVVGSELYLQLVTSFKTKTRSGTDVTLSSNLPVLGFAQHGSYVSDTEKLVAYATDPDSPFSKTPFAQAIAAGVVYTGTVPQIAIGNGSSAGGLMTTVAGDVYALGDRGQSNLILYGGAITNTRTIDGGPHLSTAIDTVFVTGNYTWTYTEQEDGSFDLFATPWLGGSPVEAAVLYRIDRLFTPAPSALPNPANLFINLDGVETTVQETVLGQTTLTVTGVSEVAYGSGSVSDIESDVAFAGVMYGPEVSFVHVVGNGSVIVSDGAPSTTPVTIDSGGGAVAAYGGTAPTTFVGYLAGASFAGGSGATTLDYSALSCGVTIDIANGIAAGNNGGEDQFSGVDSFVGSNSGNNVVELANTSSLNTIEGLASSLVNFGTVAVDPDASWILDGTNAFAIGTTVEIGVLGSLQIAGTFAGNPVFSLASATLTVDGESEAQGFELQNGENTLALTRMENTESFSDPISGVSAFDTIELPGVTFSPGDTASYNASAEMLTISQGATPVFTFENLQIGSLASGLFSAGMNYVEEVACFADGTHIATLAGEARVEHLAVGDLVYGRFHGLTPIKWVGYRQVDCRRHEQPSKVRPVRVRRGAFGDGVPCRDLRLSPDHAILADDTLIPVRHLINGKTIFQERVDSVTYWHFELHRHDVILAENLPAESYLDTGNRSQFANGGPAVTLHPDFARRAWDQACAKLVQEGPRVASLKEALFRRAGIQESAPQVTLCVQAERKSLSPRILSPGLWCYEVPQKISSLRFRTPAWVPAHRQAISLDQRQLGTRIFRLTTNGLDCPLDGPAFVSGFHPVEETAEGLCRWTNGDARLMLPTGTRNFLLQVGEETIIEESLRRVSW